MTFVIVLSNIQSRFRRTEAPQTAEAERAHVHVHAPVLKAASDVRLSVCGAPPPGGLLVPQAQMKCNRADSIGTPPPRKSRQLNPSDPSEASQPGWEMKQRRLIRWQGGEEEKGQVSRFSRSPPQEATSRVRTSGRPWKLQGVWSGFRGPEGGRAGPAGRVPSGRSCSFPAVWTVCVWSHHTHSFMMVTF